MHVQHATSCIHSKVSPLCTLLGCVASLRNSLKQHGKEADVDMHIVAMRLHVPNMSLKQFVTMHAPPLDA